MSGTRLPSGVHLAGRAHDILLVALIALRPLVWSGDAGAWDNLAWLLLTIIALAWLVVDAWRGRLPAWRFGIGGILAALLLVILLPAALRSPYPSTGMGLWGMAVIHLGFAAYLMQVVPGRERLTFGALMGALAVECLVALGQWAWVLPGMSAALAAGDPAVRALENDTGDLSNRLTYGGLFGTFTLANTLAAFLLLAATPLIGVACAARSSARWLALALLAIVGVVACGTASKGALVALALAGGVVWSLQRRDRWRWLPLAAGIMLCGLIAAVPAVRAIGQASAEVRLGYWQGATALVAERPLSGHGLHGFTAHAGRTLPLDAEPTRHVHNDVLEATVDGGVLAGLALATLLLWLARRREPTGPAEPTAGTDAAMRMWRSTWPLLLIVPLFGAVGMLASNLEWWPLGAGETTWWLWPLLLTGVLITVAMLSIRLPLPPTWAWRLALVAFALHCLVDFNLQSPGLWGTLIIVAALAGGRTLAVGSCRISRSAVTVLVAGLAVGLMIGVRQATTRAIAGTSLGTTMAQADREHMIELAERWPMDVGLLLRCVREQVPGAGRLALTASLSGRLPWHGEAHEALAVDLALSGRWDEGIAAMRTAIADNPAYLQRRELLVGLLRFAAEALPARSAALLAEATEEQRLIADLASRVHPRNRQRRAVGHGSALSVEPAP